MLLFIVVISSCNKSNGDKIFLSLDPKIDFTYEIDIPTKTVVCTNGSENLKNYTWYFSDGETSKEKSPKHTFQSEGSFQISLSATTLKSAETMKKTVEIVIGDPQGHKPKVELTECEDLDFAGFSIKWTRTNSHISPILTLQIASDEVFENIVREERVDSYTQNMKYRATDLDIKTKYWYRIQVRYRESAEDEIYYSNTKTATTADMPKPFAMFVTNPTSGSFSWFEVNTGDVQTDNNYSKRITHKLQISRDKDFKEGFEAKNTCVFKKYFKEPRTKFYAKYTATYKDNIRTFEDSQEYTFNYIFSTGNGSGKIGEYTKKYIKDGKTMLEFGDKEGAKIVFQIKDFNGLGQYSLSYNSDDINVDNSVINTAEDSYAYYLDGKKDFKYYLNKKGISLDIYREDENFYYCKILSEDNFKSLPFKQKIEEIVNYNRYIIYDPFFVISK